MKLIKYCEFDRFASASYDALHGTTPEDNLGDITKVEELPRGIY